MDFYSANTFFERILTNELIINNANASMLTEFISLWTASAFSNGTLLSFTRDWFKKVRMLYEQQKVNHAIILTTVLLLEEIFKKLDVALSSEIFEESVSAFLFVNEIMIAYAEKLEEVSCENDAFLAFHRLHYQLSGRKESAAVIKKYNLWKKLLHFYLESNKFYLRIQNFCTEYVINLVVSDLPWNITLFMDAVHICIQYIKIAIDGREKHANQMLNRSVRLLYQLLLRFAGGLEKSVLLILSKHFRSFSPYFKHVLMTSNDPITICYTLKIFVLVECCFIITDKENHENDRSTSIILMLRQIITENSKLNSYMPEILCMDFRENEWKPKLQVYLMYLHIVSIQLYLQYLNISVDLERYSQSLNVPEDTKKFVNDYQTILEQQGFCSSVVNGILKNFKCIKISENFQNLYLSLFAFILKSIHDTSNEISNEVSMMMINVIYALETILANDFNSASSSNLDHALLTCFHIVWVESRYSLVLRLSALRLCCLIVRHLETFSCDSVEDFQTTIIRGLNDSDWQVRDSVLELLIKILETRSVEYNVIMDNHVVCQVLLKARKDDESSVRSSVYTVLIILISEPRDQHAFNSYINYQDVISNVVNEFRQETEDDVREQMIKFIFQYWKTVHIPENLLIEIYKVVFDASRNDLNSDIRRRGMIFWQALVRVLINCCKTGDVQEVLKIMETMGCVGCLQAVVDGIEDEYDQEVTKVALSILRSLKNFINFKENYSLRVDNAVFEKNPEECLPNKLPFSNDVNLKYIHSKDFLNKYCNTDIEKLEKTLVRDEVFNMKNLLDCFNDISCESGVNSKDCY